MQVAEEYYYLSIVALQSKKKIMLNAQMHTFPFFIPVSAFAGAFDKLL